MRVLAAIVCVVILVPLSAAAQSVPQSALTLEQVLELAEARSEAVAIARTGVSRAEGEQIRARSGLFPQLNVSLSYDRALASEFEGVFDDIDFGGPDPAPGDPTATDDGLNDLPFGRANTWRLNLTFSQNIFD